MLPIHGSEALNKCRIEAKADMDLQKFIGETTDYDKKEALEERRPKSWLKSVSAFANGQGGVLIFGVTDDDRLTGVPDVKRVSERISEILKMKMQPVPDTRLQIHRISGLDILTLEVFPGQETPYYYAADGRLETYTRIGNESVLTDAMTTKRLILRGRHSSWDILPSGYDFADFAFSKFRERYHTWTQHSFDEKNYESYGICNHEGQLSNAGALLADDSPIRFSRLFCTRWNGLDKTGGILEALDSAEYSGSIILLLENGLNFLRKHNHLMWKKLPASRLELPDYVERSVFEVLVNALVHRDYLEIGSEVHLDIFDDRLEIYSPGGMMDGTLIQNWELSDVPSKRRNPLLADIFGRLGYMERQGSGLGKIMEYYQAASNYTGEKLPVFYSAQTIFRVTLKNLNYRKEENVPRNVSRNVSRNVPREEWKKAIMEMIYSNSHVTRREMAERIGKNEKTVGRMIAQMGNVNYVGKGKNGHWELD